MKSPRIVALPWACLVLVIGLTRAAPTVCATEIAVADIKAAWLFREGEGEMVRDWISHQPGAIRGTTRWTTTPRGPALAVEGGFVAVPELGFTDSEPWTVVAWLRDESRDTVYSYWLGRGTGSEAITVRKSNRDQICFRDKNAKFHLLADSAPYKNDWHHYAFVADGTGALTLHIDGVRIGHVVNVATQLRIGRIGTSHARYSFRGEIGPVLVFGKALTREQIEAVMTTPAAQLVFGGKIMGTPLFQRRVFSRDEDRVELEVSLENVSSERWSGSAILELDGMVLGRKAATLALGESRRLKAVLRPERLTAGNYELRVVQRERPAAEASSQLVAELTIAPWRNARQFPLIAWPRLYEVRWIESMREAGISVLPFNSVETLDAITGLGGYGSTHLRTMPVHPPVKQEDRDKTCPVSPAYLQACEEAAEELIERIGNHPALRLVVVNTETWGELCFCALCSDSIRSKFGIDPRELEEAVKAGGVRRHKAHALMPKLPAYARDTDVVADSNPLLRLAHWWWTEGGPNVGNQRVAEVLHKLNPNAWTMTEPLTRFAPLRRYHRPMVISCWSYPAEPRDWIITAAYLQGLARNMDCPLVITLGTLKLAGTLAPYTTTSPPDVFRLENWICLAHLPVGLQYFTWEVTQAPENQPVRKKVNVVHRQVCEEAVTGLSWDEACKKGKTLPQAWSPGIPEEIRHFSDRVILPLGPLLRQARPAQARVGVLYSFTTALMSRRGWYFTFDWFPVVRNILRSPYAMDVVFEKELEDRRFLSRYDVMILPSCYVLTERVLTRLQAFIARGGTVLCGVEREPKLPGCVVVPELDYRPPVTMHPTVPERAWDAPDARFGARAPDSHEALQQALRSAIGPPEHRSTAPDVLIREGHLSHTRLLFVVNTRLVAGPQFGHYPKSLERGEPIESRISLRRGLELHGYDLLEARPLPAVETDGYIEFDAALPPTAGRVYAFYREQVGALTLAVPAKCRAGNKLKAIVRLRNAHGKAFKGAVPVRFDLTGPDGSASDLSHYSVMQDGSWQFRWRVPNATKSTAGAVHGAWTVSVHELASGQTAQTTVRVMP